MYTLLSQPPFDLEQELCPYPGPLSIGFKCPFSPNNEKKSQCGETKKCGSSMENVDL
jgi:hypothetical protein